MTINFHKLISRRRLVAGLGTAGAVMLAVSAVRGGGDLKEVSPTGNVRPSPTPLPPGVTRRIRGGGYELDLTLQQSLDFAVTKNVFEGVVERTLPPRYVNTGVIEYVYTPVVVRVIAMHRGELPSDGTFILRAFGGIAEGVEFTSSLAPSPEVLEEGAQLLVFSAETVMVKGDGAMEALSPHGIFLKDGTTLRQVTFGRHNGPESEGPVSLERAASVLGRRLSF